MQFETNSFSITSTGFMIAQDRGDQEDSSAAARAFKNNWIASGGFIFVCFTSLVVFDVLQDFTDDHFKEKKKKKALHHKNYTADAVRNGKRGFVERSG